MSSLFPPHPRRFVPSDLDAGSLEQLEPLFDELAARTTRELPALQRWLVDESELLSTIAAEVARRYVRMTRHTDDARAKDAFLAMEQTVRIDDAAIVLRTGSGSRRRNRAPDRSDLFATRCALFGHG